MKRTVALLMITAILFFATGCEHSAPAESLLSSSSQPELSTPSPVSTPAPVESMRDAVGTLVVYCLERGLTSWEPTVSFDYDTHFILSIYANHCFGSDTDRVMKNPVFDPDYSDYGIVVDGSDLRNAAAAIFPDFNGVIPGEDVTDPHFTWFWLEPCENDQFFARMGDEGEWVDALLSADYGEDGVVTAKFSIREYSDLTDIGVCRAQLLPNPEGSKFGYIIQKIEIDLTQEQELATQEQNPIGWFTTVGGAEFFLPEGFQIETRPNGPRGMGLHFYYFYHPELDMRIDVSEFLYASGYAQEGDWLQEQYDGLKRSFSSTMTYDSRYEGGFAVSGIQDGRIYYDRGWESSDNKGILFIIDYPESRASVCNDVVTQFFESFTPPQN